jgi:hypothetical protein
MFKDRRVLLEHDLKVAHDQASRMYLDIVTQGKDVHSGEYQKLRDQISKLEFDLHMVNQLINQGHV